MKDVNKTAVHTSGKVLRTGDPVLCYGQKCEFVCQYRGRIIVYSIDGHVCADIPSWEYVHVYDPPDTVMANRNMEPMFEMEA